jgi:hypothetical protein
MIGPWCCAAVREAKLSPLGESRRPISLNFCRSVAERKTQLCPANQTLSTALELRSCWHRNQPLAGPNASPRHPKIYVLRS